MKLHTIIMGLILFTSAAQANQIFPTRFQSTENKSTTASKVIYYGGPVIGHAKVYTVFWGSEINKEIKSEMPNFYNSVLNSDHMDWLTEYNTNIPAKDGRAGTNQSIGRGTYGGTFEIKPTTFSFNGVLDDSQIQIELVRQIKAGVLPMPTADTLFMIHFPAGLSITIPDGKGGVATSCQQFCAYHMGFTTTNGVNVYYGVIPDLNSFACSMGCGFGNSMDRVTIASSHELIEAVTDAIPTPGDQPAFPQAWNTLDGQEVGDLCQSETATLTTSTKTYKIQQEWSNQLNSCTHGNWKSSI